MMNWLTIAIFVGASALPIPVLAQNLAPGPAKPNVVMQCFENDKPTSDCQFSCGGLLAQAPNGRETNFSGVSRVEFYYDKQGAQHTWVFIAAAPAANVYTLYLGRDDFCGATIHQNVGEGAKIIQELRITSFQP